MKDNPLTAITPAVIRGFPGWVRNDYNLDAATVHICGCEPAKGARIVARVMAMIRKLVAKWGRETGCIFRETCPRR